MVRVSLCVAKTLELCNENNSINNDLGPADEAADADECETCEGVCLDACSLNIEMTWIPAHLLWS